MCVVSYSADVMVRRCINVHGRLCKLIQLANLHTPYLEAQMAKHILTFAHLPLKHMNLNELDLDESWAPTHVTMFLHLTGS